MRELGRVFNRKTFLILAVLCAMNLILFLLSIDPEKMITQQGEELEAYLNRYPVFLKNTVENGSKMGMLSMYKDGFGSESLNKTTELYKALDGTKVQAGENRGIVLFIQYQLTDLFLLVFLFLNFQDLSLYFDQVDHQSSNHKTTQHNLPDHHTT